MEILKQFIRQYKSTILKITSISIITIASVKIIPRIFFYPNLHLSDFLINLSANKISEVIDHGCLLTCNFQNIWYIVDRRMITDSQLFIELVTKKCQFQSGLNYNNFIKMGTYMFTTFVSLYSLKLVSSGFDLFGSEKNLKWDIPNPKIYFKNIAGNQEAKQQLQEIIYHLKNPGKLKKYQANPLKGVLLYGPTGHGKTMLAKATACEANVAFLYQPASEFIEKFAGIGAKRIRHLFKLAKSETNGCIIFIDEIEAIGMARSNSFKNHEQATTLNQMLIEMDGFYQNNIVVIAATNRPQLLDPALLRMGRFDRKIYIGELSLEEKFELAKLLSEGYQVQEADLLKLSKLLEGFSGAEICSVFNESKIKCAREQDKILNLEYGIMQVLKYRQIDSNESLFQTIKELL